MSAAREAEDRLRQATDHHRHGRLDEAERLYGRLIEDNPEHFDALNRLAIVAMQRGEFEKALARIDRALRVTPTSAAATLNKGSILVALKRHGEALAAYDRALDLDSDDPDTHYNRANLLKEMGRPGQALPSYEEVIKRRPDDAAAHFNRGRMLFELKRLGEALSSYDEAIALSPSTEVYFHRGNALKSLLRLDEAVASYSQAIVLNSGNISAYLNRANALRDLKRPQDALTSCDEVLAIKPDFAEALSSRGNALLDLARPEDALASYDKALEIKPDLAEVLNNRGSALLDLKRPEDALASFDRALAIRPDYAEALNNRGTALLRLRRFEEALTCYDRALAIRPDFAQALNDRGSALLSLKRSKEALASCAQALVATPDYVEALINLGNALFDLRRPEEALASYEKALALKPGSVEALNNRANALLNLKRFEEAVAACDQTLAVKPDLAEALVIRGHALSDLKRPGPALESYDKALEIKPNSIAALAARAHAAALTCSWAGSADIHARLRASVEEASFGGNNNCFAILSIFDDPVLQRRVAERYCADKTGSAGKSVGPTKDVGKGRLRVGYLSADFRTHPVTFLTTGLVEAHDRSFCEVYGFSASAEDGSPERKRLMAAFDHIVDVSALSDEAICGEIRRAGIDILIDLGGHTRDSRMLALAERPAPIQVSYLGYPGTVGASFIDYIVADRFVIPEDAVQNYTEQVIYLPDCFQANDDKRIIATRVPSRQQCGLSEGGFVFCAFHSSYKLNADVFDVWMRLLKAIPGSVIWLTAGADTHDNLRREVGARGIDPARLVFAGSARYPDHLARQKLADLFIDAWPYNGGTTASDALWVGLPVLTLAGRSYAARMAGSLLHAIGLPELVTYSSEEYEALALRLAREPALLETVRRKLAANIGTAPLFDTARFTRHMEAAYAMMWETHQRGERPHGFSVRPVAARSNSSYQSAHSPNRS
jgi:predicted O-linked N-acetylglucosamine transferase (SPINDLY family)